MDQALISVIVPVYNCAFYLKKCVCSIARQSFERIEIVLIDDGSTDGSAQLCDDLARTDKRIRIVHKRNGGVSSARNLGIDRSSGEYICFVDSDDWLPSDALETLYGRLTADGSDYCAGKVRVVALKSGRMLQAVPDTCLNTANKAAFEAFYSRLLGSACGALFKTSVIREHAVRFMENVKFSEDTMFLLDYLKHCRRVSGCDHAVYYYNLLMSDTAIRKFYPDFRNWGSLCIDKYWALFAADGYPSALTCEYLRHNLLSQYGHYARFLEKDEAVRLIDDISKKFGNRYGETAKNDAELRRLLREPAETTYAQCREMINSGLEYPNKVKTVLRKMKLKLLYRFDGGTS